METVSSTFVSSFLLRVGIAITSGSWVHIFSSTYGKVFWGVTSPVPAPEVSGLEEGASEDRVV
jgi:hypothetical protein